MTRLQMNLAYRTGEELLPTNCECIKGVQAKSLQGAVSLYIAHLCVQVTVRRPSSWRTG